MRKPYSLGDAASEIMRNGNKRARIARGFFRSESNVSYRGVSTFLTQDLIETTSEPLEEQLMMYNEVSSHSLLEEHTTGLRKRKGK